MPIRDTKSQKICVTVCTVLSGFFMLTFHWPSKPCNDFVLSAVLQRLKFYPLLMRVLQNSPQARIVTLMWSGAPGELNTGSLLSLPYSLLWRRWSVVPGGRCQASRVVCLLGRRSAACTKINSPVTSLNLGTDTVRAPRYSGVTGHDFQPQPHFDCTKHSPTVVLRV